MRHNPNSVKIGVSSEVVPATYKKKKAVVPAPKIVDEEEKPTPDAEGEGKTMRVAPVVHLNGHTEPPSVGQALKAQPAMDKGHEGCSKLPSELRRCTVDGTGRTGNCATRTDEP